jgi:UDP-glucuronate decarboxylase
MGQDQIKSRIISEDIAALAGIFTPYREFFEGRRFLLTGAGGFLGKYVVLLLKHMNDHVLKKPASALFLDNFVTGYEATVVSDENLKFIKHNVIEPFDTPLDIDYVIHAAGIASPLYYTKFPVETMDVTTIGTRNMLELARRKNVKGFLFTSSSEVYGDPDEKHVPTKETYNGNVSIIGPRACYDESKRFAEILCTTFHRVYGLPVKIVRYFNVFGPGIRLNDYRVLPNFIEHGLRGEPITIHGDGKNTRSFCYISDAIEGTLKLLFSKALGEAFNVGNPSLEISLVDLAALVKELFNGKVAINHVEPPHAVYGASDPKRRCPDISKLKSVIDFEPRHALRESVQRTIEWYREVIT